MFVKQPLASCKSNLIFASTFAHLLQSSIDKKMVVVEYWQYLANLTQAITHKESNIFAIFIPDAKLEDFGTFLYVFIWALVRFLCNTNQLWVIIPITIFFPMQDSFARQIKKNVPIYFGRLLDCLLYNHTCEWIRHWPCFFTSYIKSILQV